MRYSKYSFKHAELILRDMKMLKEIDNILKSINTPLGRNVKPTPHKVITNAFMKKGWRGPQTSGLKVDLCKNKVAIEIELTDPRDCYNDYLNFLQAYNNKIIDVGVQIVYDDSLKSKYKNIPTIDKS